MTWKPDPVLRLLLAWTALTTLVFWLPFIRTLMDGPTYEWGLAGLSGRRLQGDFWFPALGAALALSIRYFGWRGARLPFHALLLLWLVPLGALASWAALSEPEQFRFQGDTLGVDIPLAWAGPAIFGGMALLAVFWVVRNLRSGPRGSHREILPWTPTNRALTLALVGLLPVQFLLLRFGEPHGTTDQIGVILTIAQWLLVGFALKPRVADRTHAPRLSG